MSVGGAQRRTQAERRAATQAALLDATLECLVEYGYANTTTARIVDRAGVSRGAQGHYFKTKQELVIAALRHLTAKQTAEFGERLATNGKQIPSRIEEMLDQLWDLHRSSTFAASMELWIAARTDPELREGLGDVEREVAREIAKGVSEVLGARADRRAIDFLATALATMRGLALLQFVSDPEYVEQRWRATRRQLLELLPDALRPAQT